MKKTEEKIQLMGGMLGKLRSIRPKYVIAVLLTLVGLGMALYPLVSNLNYQHEQKELQEIYENTVYELSPESTNTALEDCRVYNESLLDSNVQLTDPFDESALEQEPHPYVDLLNLQGDGCMGSIEIPSIHCYLMVYHGTDESVLQKGVGHLQGSSLPIGGVGTHSILSAHTGSTKELFTNLDQVQLGEVFYLYMLGEKLAYQVDSINVVLPDDTSHLMIDATQDYVTLVTCTPYGINSHRLLVRGTRIDSDTAQAVEQAQEEHVNSWTQHYLKSIAAGGVCALVLYGALWVVLRVVRR